ncbi:hypothetical protein [Sphingomonas glacialis]|uniref:Uncharacterized protein n=1 Tax=Sphingomonas glacialis TaxID=658225 RepID=A0A502FQ55_9SPHN|nr:hypothetical protein [Sphingomonas glacialis]TPG51678.1 hypothetical protein EAH76_16830 [Sphingomonas glacialis]
MALRLVSFADGAFAGRGVDFRAEAEAIELYDSIDIYDFASLPEEFKLAHGEFVHERKQGFGYWIWKPRIVLMTMLQSAPDDIIVYSDVGFTINAAGRNRMLEYFDIVRSSTHKMLSFYNTHIEAHWTKADLAVRLGVQNNGAVMFTTQIAAGFFIVMPTIRNIGIMQRWCDISVEDNYRYSDDSPSIVPNHPSFGEHRHDASIGSLIRKIEGTELSHYEVQGYDRVYDHYRPALPMWATRTGRIGPKP